jgi:type II secretory pathway component PulF
MAASSVQGFQYRAVDAEGRAVNGALEAADEREALSRLAMDGLTVIELKSNAPAKKRTGGTITPEVRVSVLRQLAVMSRAGVDLLESLESMAAGMEGPAGHRLLQVAAGLRRGETLSASLRAEFRGYPEYVYALLQVGDATGKRDQAIEDAARQLAMELRVQKDVANSLSYPAFLIVAGSLAVAFLFYEVVPKFADMIGGNVDELDGLSGWVLSSGLFFRQNALAVLAVIGGIVAVAALTLNSPSGRRGLYDTAINVPVLGGILKSRERATWARILHLALSNGVVLLDAVRLASASIPPGGFQRGLTAVERLVRAGRRFDQALAENRLLTNLDRSLIAAGLRSGALGPMMKAVADRYDEALQDDLKRLTALIEPLAIGIVALLVGAVAIGLITAMTSVYDGVL